MKTKKKKLASLQKDVNKKNSKEDKLISLIAELYSEAVSEGNREDKFLLDRLEKVMDGKKIIFENSSMPYSE